MGYSDQKYFARPQVDYGVFDLGTSTGAGTASNSLTQTAANMLPAYARRTQIGNVEVEVIAAPNAAATALVVFDRGGYAYHSYCFTNPYGSYDSG